MNEYIRIQSVTAHRTFRYCKISNSSEDFGVIEYNDTITDVDTKEWDIEPGYLVYGVSNDMGTSGVFWTKSSFEREFKSPFNIMMAFNDIR